MARGNPRRRSIIAYDWKTEIPGVFARHDDSCPVRNGRWCSCGVLGYRSSLRDWETNSRIISPQFPSIGEAQAWQRDQFSSLQAVRGVPLEGKELGDVIDEFLQAVEDGRARDREDEPYTRDARRDLRGALSYVDAELGLLNAADPAAKTCRASWTGSLEPG